MAHIHEGSVSSSFYWHHNDFLMTKKATYLTHKCKSCGESTGRGLHIDLEPHLCDTCLLIEKRDSKLNSLLNKKWWELWK